MSPEHDPEPLADLVVPAGRDRLGLAHQLRVDVSIAISMLPMWVKRMLGDKDPLRARSARAEVAERIALSLERRFRITWIGSDDARENARPASKSARPLFGGPAAASRAGGDALGTRVDAAKWRLAR